MVLTIGYAHFYLKKIFQGGGCMIHVIIYYRCWGISILRYAFVPKIVLKRMNVIRKKTECFSFIILQAIAIMIDLKVPDLMTKLSILDKKSLRNEKNLFYLLGFFKSSISSDPSVQLKTLETIHDIFEKQEHFLKKAYVLAVKHFYVEQCLIYENKTTPFQNYQLIDDVFKTSTAMQKIIQESIQHKRPSSSKTQVAIQLKERLYDLSDRILHTINYDSYSKAKTFAFVHTIKDELNMYAWHPSRLPWCLDHNQCLFWGL